MKYTLLYIKPIPITNQITCQTFSFTSSLRATKASRHYCSIKIKLQFLNSDGYKCENYYQSEALARGFNEVRRITS